MSVMFVLMVFATGHVTSALTQSLINLSRGKLHSFYLNSVAERTEFQAGEATSSHLISVRQS